MLFGGDVLGGLAERDRVIAKIGHARIGETPAKCCVHENALAARESLRRLQRHERRARHALDAAGDDEVGLAGADASGRVVHRFEATSAEAVHGDARYGFGESREERRHATDVAVVLAGLI